ncbi:MAG TPA: YciI family protein [Nocardioidaceae bacterium]|nr:YciI family protein [Nocardioidaceae bacterium]
MKYVLMFTSDTELDAAIDPEVAEKTYQEIFAWFEEHDKAGRFAGGGAELQPVTTATTVRSGDNGGRVVVDGPFSESKEVVGGFTVIDVPDLDSAISMAKSWPSLALPGHSVEIRPIVEHG